MAKIITSPSNWPTPELAKQAAELLEWRFDSYPKETQDKIAHQQKTNNPGPELEGFLNDAFADCYKFCQNHPEITDKGIVHFSFE